MNDIFRSIPRGSVAFLILTAFGAVKGFAVIPLVFGILGAEGYGGYVLVASSIGYGAIVSNLGLDTALYRYLPSQRDNPHRTVAIFNGIAQASLVWNGILVLAVVVIVAVTGQPSMWGELVVSGGAIVAATALFGVAAAEFRAREKLLSFCGLVILFQSVELAALLAGAYVFEEIGAMFRLMAISDFLVAVVVLGVRWTTIGLVRPARSDIWNSLRFGAHSVIGQAVNSSVFILDKYLLTAFAGVAALASYGLAFAVSGVLLQIVGIVALLVPTLFARAFDRNDLQEQANVLTDGFRKYAALAVPAAVGIVYIGKPLMAQLTNPAVAEKAYPVALILSLSFVINGCSRILVIAIRTAGDQMFVSTILALSLAIFLGISALVLMSGLEPGVSIAVGMLFASIAQLVIFFWRAQLKGIPIELDIGMWGWPIIASGMMGIPIFWIPADGPVVLTVAILSAIPIYAGCMFLIHRR